MRPKLNRPKLNQEAKPWVSDPEMDAAMKKLWRANCRLKQASHWMLSAAIIDREIGIVDERIRDLIGTIRERES